MQPSEQGLGRPHEDANTVLACLVVELNMSQETPEHSVCKCIAGAGNLSLLKVFPEIGTLEAPSVVVLDRGQWSSLSLGAPQQLSSALQ